MLLSTRQLKCLHVGCFSTQTQTLIEMLLLGLPTTLAVGSHVDPHSDQLTPPTGGILDCRNHDFRNYDFFFYSSVPCFGVKPWGI